MLSLNHALLTASLITYHSLVTPPYQMKWPQGIALARSWKPSGAADEAICVQNLPFKLCLSAVQLHVLLMYHAHAATHKY